MKEFCTGALALLTALSMFSSCAKPVDEPKQIDNVYIVPNTKSILREEMPPKTGGDRLTASLAKNEGEGMQFLLRFDTDVTNVKVTVSDLVNKNGEKLDYILYRQHYIEVLDQRYPTARGFYPDALVPMFDGTDGKPANDSCDITAEQNQGYWITVRSTLEQAPGLYSGSVRVTFDGGEREIPILVEVWDFALPVKSSMQTNFLHSWSNFYYEDVGISSKEMNRMAWEFFLPYRISGNYMYFIEHESFGSDLDHYIKAIKEFIDEHPQVTSFQLPLHGWRSDGSVDPEEVMNNKNNKRIYELLKRYDLVDLACYYGIDEPADTEENRRIIKNLSDSIKGFAPDVKNIVTTEREKYNGDVSCWCPIWDRIDENFVKTKQAQGDHVWWYGCAVPSAPYPTYHLNDELLSPRIVHWMQKDIGVEGELFWATTLFEYYKGGGQYVARDVWSNPYTSEGLPGDGYLCYPGKEGDGIVGRNMLIPTLRLEAIRDGLEDYEYLTLIEKKIRTFTEKHEIGVTADKILETYMQPLYRSIGDYEHDGSILQNVRKEIAEDLLNGDESFLISVERNNADGTNTVNVYSEKKVPVKSASGVFKRTEKGGCFVYTLTVPKSENVAQIEIRIGDKVFHRHLGTSSCTHELRKIDAVKASCMAGGYINHYICNKCGARFLDENAEKAAASVEELAVPMLKYHKDGDSDGLCDTCGKTK